MAKISFTKLDLKFNQDIKTITWNNQIIEIKQYLPIEEKLQLISNIVNLSHEGENFSNPAKNKIYLCLEIISFYTNIKFTEKQKENVFKLYDLIVSSGLYLNVYNNIPQEEYQILYTTLMETIDSVYKYKNSILGILEAVNEDYNNISFDAQALKDELVNPENVKMLREVLEKLD